MKKQNFEEKNIRINNAFSKLKKEKPENFKKKLKLSWSNWGFGMEKLSDTAERLAKAEIRYIELHGNHYGPALGYKAGETLKILGDHGISMAGICGIFSEDNDLSSNRAIQRQAALDYIRRELDFASETGASYILIVPGAVGRPQPYDDMEFARSAETLALLGDEFASRRIRAAIEPIRSAEVSIVHSIADAVKYIKAIGHPGIQSINADTYHMQSEEPHIGEALLSAAEYLVNLHVADSTRGPLGTASLDLDTVIKTLYLINFNMNDCFVTPEPLGSNANPYSAMFGCPDKAALDNMVMTTSAYFREREKYIIS